MTKSERREVAATLREWAEIVYLGKKDVLSIPNRVYLLTRPFWASDDGDWTEFHSGHAAATGLLLAAAMVESGDDL